MVLTPQRISDYGIYLCVQPLIKKCAMLHSPMSIYTLYMANLKKNNIILAEIFLYFVRCHFILQINILIKSNFMEKHLQGVRAD